MLGRRLQQIGTGVICLGLMFVALRVLITRTLLPKDLTTCGLFMIADLYLLPLGVLLVLLGWRLRHSPGATRFLLGSQLMCWLRS